MACAQRRSSLGRVVPPCGRPSSQHAHSPNPLPRKQLTNGPSAPTPSLCWAPDAFASAPAEKAIFKGDHRFDAPPSRTELAPYSPIPGGLRGAIRSVKIKGPRKLIALTFDLCEQPGEIAGYDGAIFDYLRANGIKATFFAGGKWMRSHAERAQQLMSDPLFEIGNHSEAHRNLRLLSGARLDDEILAPERAFENLRRNLDRAPMHARRRGRRHQRSRPAWGSSVFLMAPAVPKPSRP